MVGPERRQGSRTTLGALLPYILVEPDNGAMVSNVSEGGLSFQSVAPVVSNGDATIHFCFTDCEERIRAGGRLAWSDKTKTAGGLQFTPALSGEARRQIEKWIREAVPPLAAEEPVASSLSSSSVLSACEVSATAALPVAALPPVALQDAAPPDVSRTSRPDSSRTSAECAPVAGVASRGLSALWSALSSAVSSSMSLVVIARSFVARRTAQGSGFSRGFAAGFLLAAVVAGAFFFHSYQRQLGESIIRLGQHLAKDQPQSHQGVTPPRNLPAPLPYAPQAESAVANPVPEPQSGRSVAGPAAAPPRAQNEAPDVTIKLFPVTTSVSAPARIPKAIPRATAEVATIAPPKTPLPPSVVAGDSGPSLPEIETLPQLASGQDVVEPPVETYLEVAKFKDELPAHSAMDRLVQLGFPATVIQKGLLWMNAYHVLVGPYVSAGAAKAASRKLASRGFQPRSFERGSRYFRLPTPLELSGKALPVGDFVISWESYANAATVTLLQGNRVVATAEASWIRPRWSRDDNAVVYRRNADGSRTLLEFHFHGMAKALAFRGSPALSGGLLPCCMPSAAAAQSPAPGVAATRETAAFGFQGKRPGL